MTVSDYILLGITILTGILTIIEKSKKLKINPWSWLFGRSETDRKIDALTDKICQLSLELTESSRIELEHYRKQAKMFISDFASDLRNNTDEDILMIKTKGQFCSIIDLCNEYIDKGWNTEVRHDAEYIREVYYSLKNRR